MNTEWRYGMSGATSLLDRQGAEVPPGRFFQLWGVDGRLDGILRRYPGHVPYGSGTTIPGEASRVRYFQTRVDKSTDDMIRGFVVETTDNKLHLWYRKESDAAGAMRVKTLVGPATTMALLDGTTDAAIVGGVGPGVDSQRYLAEVWDVTQHTDDTGTYWVACGTFSQAGSRNCNQVCRFNGKYWEPMGQGVLGLGTRLLSYQNELYLGGFYWETGDGTRGSGVSRWDGARWVPLLIPSIQSLNSADNSPPDIHVLAGFSRTVASETRHYLFIAGQFYAGSGQPSHVALYDITNNADVTPDLISVPDTSTRLNATMATGYVLSGIWHSGSGRIFLGGSFDDNTLPYPAHVIALEPVATDFTGWTFISFNTGLTGAPNGNVYEIIPDKDSDKIWATGSFTTFGSPATPARIVRYFAVGTPTSLTYHQQNPLGGLGNYFGLYVEPTGNTMWASGSFSSVESTAGAGDGISTPGGVVKLTGNVGFAVRSAVSGLVGTATRLKVHTANPLKLWCGAFSSSGEANPKVLWSGDTWDITSRGRFLYLVTSRGNNLVLNWDEATTDWVVNRMGSGALEYPPPDTSVAPTGLPAPPTGNLLGQVVGGFEVAYRFRDKVRGRTTGLSYGAPYVISTFGNEFAYVQNTGANTVGLVRSEGTNAIHNTLRGAPKGYQTVQIFSSISSKDYQIPGGGTKYLVQEASVNPGTRGFTVTFTQPVKSDDGVGNSTNALPEEVYPTQEPYRVFFDIVGDLGAAVAIQWYANMMVALEVEDEFFNVRWSPPLKYEPENFPAINVYRTQIPAAAASTCRMLIAGDFLYILGGDRIYRLQKAGRSVGIVEVYKGTPLLDRDSVIVVGNTIFAATETGILELNGRTGGGTQNSRFNYLFHDRWGAYLEPGDSTKSVRAAYDSRMRCVYFHHPTLEETLCLWLGTGKVTMLASHLAATVTTGQHPDTGMGLRAMWFPKVKNGGSTRFLTLPNHDPGTTVPHTQNGLKLDGSFGHHYNNVIGTMTDLGSTIELTLIENAFTTDQLDHYITVACLHGLAAGYVYRGYISAIDKVTLDWSVNQSTSVPVPSSDGTDVFAFDPVVFTAVGGPLGLGQRPDRFQRKITNRAGVVASGVSSPGVGSPTYPGESGTAGGFGLVRFGMARMSDILVRPIPNLSDVWPRTTKTMESTTDQALDEDRHHKNWVHIAADGTILFPTLNILYGNLVVDLHDMAIGGSVETSKLVANTGGSL